MRHDIHEPKPIHDFSEWCSKFRSEGKYSFKDKKERILDEIFSEEKKKKEGKNE